MTFTKYHGAGNDFIIMLAPDGQPPFDLADEALVARLCDRHFGIGADGLIILRPAPGVAFEMLYYNADGRLGSLCGNGSRCAVRAALDAGWLTVGPGEEITFLAADGPHAAALLPDGLIRLRMHDVGPARFLPEHHLGPAYFLDTGSPHMVTLLAGGLDELELMAEGRTLRYDARFAPGGTNVNFAEALPGHEGLRIRTYERGVEAETLACGTGITATALVAAQHYGMASPVSLEAIGGHLRVEFCRHPDGSFTDIALIGPAEKVFTGTISGVKAD